MAEPERIVDLLRVASGIAADKIRTIKQVTAATRILALNALVESNRAGEAGRGFAVVANEVKSISGRISKITQELETELSANINELSRLGEEMVVHVRGARLADLSLNMIEIIDRNLYERSCDVRWWATDSAVVDCLAKQDADAARFACKRLGVILDSYTVYLDLWVAGADGIVVANGRPERYPGAIGTDVSGSQWFREAMATQDGSAFVVTDVSLNDSLDGAQVATYATAVREGGDVAGRALGALGIFFDWESQSQAVVDGVRLTEDERKRTRALLIDRQGRVIAASDRRGVLRETVRLETSGSMGNYIDDNGAIVGYALTPGYETYRGLGWYGVIIQEPLA
ncbi:MAG: chemotaxis protein [Azospirillum sp.]|nr:chemotaxis protein [Azospirillum sp.]